MVTKVRFLSTNARLRMVRKPAGEQIMPNGAVALTTPEVVYEFENGGLDLFEGQDVMDDKYDPETGRFELPQDAISWIRSTPEFGDRIIEVTPEAPPSGQVLSLVAKAAAAQDVEELLRLGDEEAESWGREDVLEVIKESIVAIDPDALKAKA